MNEHSDIRRRRIARFAVTRSTALAALSACILPSRAFAAGPEGVTPQVRAAAVKEGKVTYWTSLGGAHMDIIKKEGEKALGVTVDAQRFSTFELAERALREMDGGINEVDVIVTGSSDPVTDFRKRGLSTPFIPSSIGKFRSKEYYDPDHYWTALSLDDGTIVYNTNVVKGNQIPRSWKDLTDPRYKDLLIVGSTSSGARVLAYYWCWKLYGPDYFDALKRNNIQISSSNQTAGASVSRGERPILFGDTFNYLFSKAQGAPVSLVSPREGAVTTLSTLVVVAKAPHPNAARAFADWILSPAAQAATTDVGGVSPLNDPSIKYPPEVANYLKVTKFTIATPDDVNGWWNKAGKDKITALFGGA